MVKSSAVNVSTIRSKMRAYDKGIRIAAVSTLSLVLVSGFLLAQSIEKESPAPKVNNDSYITITAVGDIMMGSTYPSDHLPPEDGKGMFAGVQEKLKAGDIVFGNLEGPLVDNGTPVKCKNKTSQCFEFVTPTRYAGHLKDAGFTVMNIANNHTFDCGVTGAENTINTLKTAEHRGNRGSNHCPHVREGKACCRCRFLVYVE